MCFTNREKIDFPFYHAKSYFFNHFLSLLFLTAYTCLTFWNFLQTSWNYILIPSFIYELRARSVAYMAEWLHSKDKAMSSKPVTHTQPPTHNHPHATTHTHTHTHKLFERWVSISVPFTWELTICFYFLVCFHKIEAAWLHSTHMTNNLCLTKHESDSWAFSQAQWGTTL
jgi:hypothetical protein